MGERLATRSVKTDARPAAAGRALCVEHIKLKGPLPRGCGKVDHVRCEARLKQACRANVTPPRRAAGSGIVGVAEAVGPVLPGQHRELLLRHRHTVADLVLDIDHVGDVGVAALQAVNVGAIRRLARGRLELQLRPVDDGRRVRNMDEVPATAAIAALRTVAAIAGIDAIIISQWLGFLLNRKVRNVSFITREPILSGNEMPLQLETTI